MAFTVDIDTGGTFTDGLFADGKEIKKVKVDTTPHDLTVCLADCLREGALQFGVSVQDMLADTDIVRYSTTVSVNTIIQRTGAKIGLIVSQGFRESLYSSSVEEIEPIFSFISKDMITDIDEEIDSKGNIIWQHTSYTDGDEYELYDVLKEKSGK